MVVCVCVCVCARARVRACACLCVCRYRPAGSDRSRWEGRSQDDEAAWLASSLVLSRSLSRTHAHTHKHIWGDTGDGMMNDDRMTIE